MEVKFLKAIFMNMVSLLTVASTNPMIARENGGLSHGSNCHSSDKATHCVLTADFWPGNGQFGNSFRIFDKDCNPISGPSSINPDPKNGARSLVSNLPYTLDLQEIKTNGMGFSFNYGPVRNQQVKYTLPPAPMGPKGEMIWEPDMDMEVGPWGQRNGVCAEEGDNKPKGHCYSVEFECH